MNIQLRSLTERIHLVTFDSQREVASTFLRFQEHYESPEFRGKVFSLGEYKKWYIENSPMGKKTGEFTYCYDWAGFNVPSYVFISFRKGDFDPLSRKEKKLLNILEDKPEPFYVIGSFRGIGYKGVVKHELAHGLFYTDEEYREEIMNVLKKFDLSKVKDNLRALASYHEDVLDDECHAYCAGGYNSTSRMMPTEMRKKIREIYKKHARKASIT